MLHADPTPSSFAVKMYFHGEKKFLNPGFHMIVTIVWIAVNDSRDPDRCDRWRIAGIEQGSILAILIVAIARIVRACFHKIAGIAGVVHGYPNDRNDYMETRLKIFFHNFAALVLSPLSYYKRKFSNGQIGANQVFCR